MKVTYDPSVDAAYIKLRRDDASPFGFTYCCDSSATNAEINIDFDASGRIIGFEVLEASNKLPLYILKAK